LSVARDNLALVKYLIGQIFETNNQRLATLRQFYPNVSADDWKLEVAGQRVQVIKPDPKRTGFLEFGTELIASADRSLIALLGASPGASTAVFIALSVLEKCFTHLLTPDGALPQLKKMIPSYGQSVLEDAELCKQIRADTAAILHLENI